MEELHATLRELQLALQMLLKKYNNLKKENEHLKNEINDVKSLLSEKERMINNAEEKMATNNVAGLYNIEEKQLLGAKIDTYLKEIEKCISMLNA